MPKGSKYSDETGGEEKKNLHIVEGVQIDIFFLGGGGGGSMVFWSKILTA
jgi:hypothetical protein